MMRAPEAPSPRAASTYAISLIVRTSPRTTRAVPIQLRSPITTAIESAVDSVIAENPEAVERYRQGEQKVVGFFVGQVMRATQGKADPKIVNELLREKLS